MEAGHRSKMDGHGPWSSKEGGCRAQILLRGGGGGYQGKATVTANALEACRSIHCTGFVHWVPWPAGPHFIRRCYRQS